jgi:hypothetical protein
VPKAVESELFTTAVASHATPFTELDAATNTAARFVCHEARCGMARCPPASQGECHQQWPVCSC